MPRAAPRGGRLGCLSAVVKLSTSVRLSSEDGDRDLAESDVCVCGPKVMDALCMHKSRSLVDYATGALPRVEALSRKGQVTTLGSMLQTLSC